MQDAPPAAGLLVAGEERAAPPALALAGGAAWAFTARAPHKDTPNEDAALLLDLGGGAGVLAVADGCGGLPQGERASATALGVLRDALLAANGAAPPEGEANGGWSARVYAAFEAASQAVAALGGPCTTLSVVLIEDGAARPFHAGDSPILVFGQRGRRKLEVVAHSPTAYAVEAGFLVEEEALLHEDRHLVLNALGAEGARIEIGAPVPLAAFDTVVVASDGLSDNLYTEETVALLRAGRLDRGLAAVAARAAERMEQEGQGGPGHADDLTLLAFRRGRAAGAPR